MIKNILKQQSVRQFIKFCFVGASGTVVDWVFYFAFTRWLGLFYLTAKALSFILAASNNYIWNRIWTFRSQEKKIAQQFLKFFVVSTVGLGLNTFIMYIVVDRVRWSDLWGLIVATALVMFWNFFANKIWTFRGDTDKN